MEEGIAGQDVRGWVVCDGRLKDKTYSFFSKRLALCKLGRYAGCTPDAVEKDRIAR
jgi:hypothetical protein